MGGNVEEKATKRINRKNRKRKASRMLDIRPSRTRSTDEFPFATSRVFLSTRNRRRKSLGFPRLNNIMETLIMIMIMTMDYGLWTMDYVVVLINKPSQLYKSYNNAYKESESV
jgi:hypothetical protein